MVGLSGSALGCPQQGRDRGWEGTRDGPRQGQDSPVSGLGGGRGHAREGPRKEEGVPSPDSLKSRGHELPTTQMCGSETQEKPKCPWSSNSNGYVPVRLLGLKEAWQAPTKDLS